MIEEQSYCQIPSKMFLGPLVGSPLLFIVPHIIWIKLIMLINITII